ncbi:tetratricopeptide repeat protein [Amycolatopsis xylanica]|uniref:tetratricopeptide repeat protein n=1 Tax=Amycolatopsis xylanica TaxID=589385 RepID=UPI001FE0DC48|nr:tetratricopeptide repeat protein [Amycolatopsis xylanica]
MGERLALVIASQCDSLNLLSFLPKAAHEVAEALLDPEIGACVPAVPSLDTGTLIDPTMVELDDALVDAFERASDTESTLFLALVGHGDYANDDFYFLTRDAQYPPDSRKSYLLAQRIKELLSRYSLLDGLVILLDTCHAGIAAVQAAERWSRIVGAAGKRFEVLTASDDRTAANGCFSLSLAKILRSGDPELGERLRCPDLKRVISGHCPAQTAVHLAFDGTWLTPKGDEGLWLARNASEAWQPLRGNPAAEEIERLTEGYRPTRELRDVVSQVLGGARCVQILGDRQEASSLLAALARPAVAGRSVPLDFLDAVLFATPGQTVEQLAGELARQLARSVPGFTEVNRPDLSAFDRSVLEPLRALDRDEPIRIAIDGIARLARFDRERLRDSLLELVHDASLDWIQLILTIEAVDPWPHSSVVIFPDNLVVRLPAEVEPPTIGPPVITDRGTSEPVAEEEEVTEFDLLELLRFTKLLGPLPVAVLLAASARSGGPDRLPILRDELFTQRDNVVRPGAGTPDEHVELLGLRARIGHITRVGDYQGTLAVLLHAIGEAAEEDLPSQRYAIANEAELYWMAGRKADAVHSLETRELGVPVENRERWAHWAARVADSVGEDDRLAIICRARHATWTGKAGDPALAIDRFQQLLPVAERELGPDDPETLSIRNNLGWQLWELNRFDEAREVFRELARDSHEALGPAHVETIHARHLLAVAEGKCGDGPELLRQERELLPDAIEALGKDHELVAKIEHNIVFWSTEIDAPPPALHEHRRLLGQERARLGERHPDFLDIWFTYALALHRHGQSGAAVAELRALLPISLEVRGEHHGETAKIRAKLAAWG